MTIIVSEHLGNTAKELANQDRLHDYLVITAGCDLDGSNGKDMTEIGISSASSSQMLVCVTRMPL